jgi:hypothetical protein
LTASSACAIPPSGFGELTTAKPIKSRIDEVLSRGRSVGEARPVWRLQPIFIEQRERQAAEHGLSFQEASSFLAHDLA